MLGKQPNLFSAVITSFSPEAGPVGTVVTIKGSNFSVAGENIIYFGAARGQVLNATDTSLQVAVPGGATFEPFTVTCNQLAGRSSKPFTTTFAGARPAFTATMFAEKIDYACSSWGYLCEVVDFDGDAKPDIITNNGGNGNYISVYLNKSTPGKIQFSLVSNISNYQAIAMAVGDLNGDGKPDFAIYNRNFGRVSFFINRCTPGNIQFVQTQSIIINGTPIQMAFGDLDNDGKPEFIFGNETDAKVYIYRNTTPNSDLSFDPLATSLSFGVNVRPQTIVAEDIDGDGKNDLVLNFNLAYNISIYRNNSSAPGTISFAPPANFATRYAPNGIAVGDLDMDGKPDIFTPASYATVLCVFKNTSTSGVISMAPRVDYATGDIPRSVALGDIDGDGLADVVVGNVNSSSVSAYKNISTPNNLLLAGKVDYSNGASPYGMAVGDLDGDGKPDITSVNDSYYRTTIFRNRQGESIVKYFCPPAATTVFTANETGLSYQWQLNTDTGYSNIANDSFYAGTNTSNLQITNAPSAWYGYQYRCVVNNDSSKSDVFELRFKSTWLGNVNPNWEEPRNWTCSAVPDSNTEVIMNSARGCIINANTAVRSLNLSASQSLQIMSGIIFSILH